MNGRVLHGDSDLGGGFAVEPRTVLTAAHIVEGVAAERLHLRIPLAGNHEERTKGRYQQEPLAQRNVGRDATGDRPEQEGTGHHGQVDHRQVLEEG